MCANDVIHTLRICNAFASNIIIIVARGRDIRVEVVIDPYYLQANPQAFCYHAPISSAFSLLALLLVHVISKVLGIPASSAAPRALPAK